MTGIVNGDLKLSRMTVGGLDDLGYCVDYDSADHYGASDLNATCTCTARVRQLEGAGNDTDGDPKRRSKLSDEGRKNAVAYGFGELEEREQYRYTNGSSDSIATGIVMVLYEENGEVYSITVTLPGK
jgi:hypothetical protein